MKNSDVQPLPETKTGATVRESKLRGKKLFAVGAAGAVALLAYYAVTAEVQDPMHLYQGMLILFLAVLPSLLWARQGGEQLPTFEVLMLMTANAYAFPLLNGHVQLEHYDPDTITNTANLVLLYQIVAICAYTLVAGRPIKTPAFRNEVLTRDLQKYVGYGLLLSSAYTFVTLYYGNLIPSEINTVLRAVCAGIGLVTTFAQSRRWGQGTLSRPEKTMLVTLVAAQAIMQFSTLFLVAGMSLILVALVGYVSGAKKLPIFAALVVFAVAAVLHNGKSTMRARYWNIDGAHRSLEIQDLPSFFTEWIDAGLSGSGRETEREMTKKLLDRTSLFHMLCMVTSLTPEHLPFLKGQTYSHVPGQFVPRFFWPGKPLAHVSTDILAIYYGLQDETTVRNATIGFGLVAEAYANFGFFGVGLLGFIFGAFYKRVHTATAQSPLLSYPGLFVIILMAWSFQTEATMAVWLGSMFQACVGVLGVPFLIRNLAG
jgi:hypothetical protein